MFRDRMSEEELTLDGEQTDLKKYVEDVGGIHGLREVHKVRGWNNICLLYTSPSPRDSDSSRMPSSA